MTRKMTPEQVKHYLLSFDDYTLIYWYNSVVIDPFQEFSEQAIRDNTENNVEDLKDLLSLETLMKVGRDKRTAYYEDDKYFCLTGADKPYIVSFSSFEEFLKVAEGEQFCQYLSEQEDDLDALQSCSDDIEERRNGKK